MQEIDRYLVVSSDGHAGLPPERYREYLDSKYHARFDAVIEAEIKKREEHEKQFLLDDFNNKWRAKAGIGLEGAWDGKIRNQVLDADGVVAEVLYPDGITERNAPPFGAAMALNLSCNGRAHKRTTAGWPNSVKTTPRAALAWP